MMFTKEKSSQYTGRLVSGNKSCKSVDYLYNKKGKIKKEIILRSTRTSLS